MARDPGLTVAGRRARLGAFVLATFLAWPHRFGEIAFDLGLVAGWAVPPLLVAGVAGLSPRAAAGRALLASLLAHALVFRWFFHVTVIYGHAPWWAGLVTPFVPGLFVAVHTALFAAAWAALAQRGLANPFAAAAVWVVVDHVRAHFLTGFPWATLGYAQHANPVLLPLASFTGVYGLSFVTALGGLGVRALLASGTRRWGAAALGAVALAHLAGAGSARLAAPGDGATRNVAVLQGNIEQGVKWSPEWAERTLRIYERLTREAARAGADLVVWPETAVPGAIERGGPLAERLGGLARAAGAPLVVGAVGIERDASARGYRFFDSAYVFERKGFVSDRYDKSHLVPFGEYVPLRGLLGLFLEAIARGIANDDVSAGAGPRALGLGPPGPAGSLGVPICYELIFPHIVRRFVDDGAELLLGITNDAWYGRTGAPDQFLAMTAVRSAESRVWTARAANTGVSAFIDPRGRVHQATPLFEEAWRMAELELRPAPLGGSFYSRHGDVFAMLCWLACAILVFQGARAGSRASPPAVAASGSRETHDPRQE